MRTRAPLQRKTPASLKRLRSNTPTEGKSTLHRKREGMGALFSDTQAGADIQRFVNLAGEVRLGPAQVIPGQCAFFTGESHRESAFYLSSGSLPPLPPWSLFIQINCVQPGTLFWSSDFGPRFNAPRKWNVRAPGSARVMTLGRAQGRVRRSKHGNQNFAFAVVSLAWR